MTMFTAIFMWELEIQTYVFERLFVKLGQATSNRKQMEIPITIRQATLSDLEEMLVIAS